MSVGRMTERDWYCECGHDPCHGLDCGAYLPGAAPRKKPPQKAAEENAAIGARRWETRRAKYGPQGHR